MRPIRTDEQREVYNKKIGNKQSIIILISVVGFLFSTVFEELYAVYSLLSLLLLPIIAFSPVGVLWVIALSFKKDLGMYENFEISRYEQAKRNGELNEDGTYKDNIL